MILKEIKDPQTWFFDSKDLYTAFMFIVILFNGFRLPHHFKLVDCTFILFLHWACGFAHSLLSFLFRLSIRWTIVLLLYYAFYPLCWFYYFDFSLYNCFYILTCLMSRGFMLYDYHDLILMSGYPMTRLVVVIFINCILWQRV